MTAVDQAGINARMFEETSVAEWYANAPLKPAEVILFMRYVSARNRPSVLDIGAGSGRTTNVLLPFTGDYVGLDLSEAMLGVCRRRFPDAELIQADLRDLTSLGTRRFDVILGSYMVLDAVSHPERLDFLNSIRSRIADGGVLLFSSHNRKHAQAGSGPRLRWSRNPFTMAQRLREHVVAVRNHRRMRELQEEREQYALFNDVSHQWQSLHYYIDRGAQECQLEDCGLSLLEVLDESGRTVPAGDSAPHSAELYYACGIG